MKRETEQEAIESIAAEHGKEVKYEKGRMMIGGEYRVEGIAGVFSQWCDATDWTKKDLLRWLGY